MGLLDHDQPQSEKPATTTTPESRTERDRVQPGRPDDPLWSMWERFYGTPPGSIRPTGI
jgi:hypothetical protein